MSKNNKQQRKLAREAVLQALYAKHVSSEDDKKVLHDIFIRYEFDKMTKKFVKELFNLTIKFSEDLDKKIESNLDNWTIDIIVDDSILCNLEFFFQLEDLLLQEWTYYY